MQENKVWYVNTNSQTYGPYTKDEVAGMLQDGSVKYSDYIFKEGFNGWEFIYNVQDFDRRLLNPGGGQPLVEAPKATVPVEEAQTTEAEAKPGEDLWFVHDGEHQMGPYSTSYIKESLNSKTLFWTYYIWREGFENWVQIKNCKEFDRRLKPRGESPVGLGITTDFDEIKEQAVKTIPKAEGGIYGDVSQPVNFQYGVSELEQQELKGKYPIKAIVVMLLIAAALFGVVRAYPWFVLRSKENKAMKMYEEGVALVEDKKYEQGFNTLTDMADMYPGTKASRKEQNYIRSKEPVIKSQLADEARKVKRSIEDYVKRYGILPANAIDIGYTQSFWMKYFGEAYYRKDLTGKISVMVRGNKVPVEGYVFTSEGVGNESEMDLTQVEFDARSQNYIKMVYTGTRTNVRPVQMPQLLKKEPVLPAPAAVPVPVQPPVLEREQAAEERKAAPAKAKPTKEVKQEEEPAYEDLPAEETETTTEEEGL